MKAVQKNKEICFDTEFANLIEIFYLNIQMNSLSLVRCVTISSLIFSLIGCGVKNDNQTPAPWAVSAGGSHTMASKTDGTLWAWGLNGTGQLGVGTISDDRIETSPIQVGKDSDWRTSSFRNNTFQP